MRGAAHPSMSERAGLLTRQADSTRTILSNAAHEEPRIMERHPQPGHNRINQGATPLIRATPLQGEDDGVDLRRLVPAFISSGVIHVVLAIIVFAIGFGDTFRS